MPHKQPNSWNSLEIAASSPGGLACYASPYPYRLAPHLQLLNDKVTEVASKPNGRLVVSMPPRHGKSELISHYTPAWYVGKHPGSQVILASYETTFAAEWGGKARSVLEEFGPPVFGAKLDERSYARSHWKVIPSSAGFASDGMATSFAQLRKVDRTASEMRTAGLGGPITGKGADLLIVDDPVKGPDDIISEASRQKMWDWWSSTAYTRLQPNGSAIVVQTRWHQDDLAGRLIQQTIDGEEEWEIINLPALAEPADILGRPEGRALWPDRFDEGRLAQIRSTIGPYWWAALYQGRPTPLEGGVLKREWMNERYKDPPVMVRKIQSVDAAFKTGVANDFSVIATWGTDGIDFYLLDVWRHKVEFPDLKAAIRDHFFKHDPSAVYVEDAASGQSIVQEMQRDTLLPVIAQVVIGSKLSRVHAVSGLFEAKKVKLPRHAHWLSDWIDEHTAFPNGAHDDQVDTTAYALHELAYQGMPVMEFV